MSEHQKNAWSCSTFNSQLFKINILYVQFEKINHKLTLLKQLLLQYFLCFTTHFKG